MKKINIYLIFLFAGIVLFSSCNKNIATTKQYYYDCPMHHDYIALTPGECPICGMELQQWEMDKSQKRSMSNSHSNHNSQSRQSGDHHH